MEILGKCLGYAGVIASGIIYQQKNRSSLLIWKGISDLLWIGHYLLIGGYTGAAVTTVALVREIIFFKSKRQSKSGIIALVCFLVLSIVISVLTWGNIFSIFAMIGSLTSIVSFWIGDPKISRILSFPISFCMLAYGLANGSLAALLNEVLVLSSSAIALLRNHKTEKNSKEE